MGLLDPSIVFHLQDRLLEAMIVVAIPPRDHATSAHSGKENAHLSVQKGSVAAVETVVGLMHSAANARERIAGKPCRSGF